jgi:hypothetical protein
MAVTQADLDSLDRALASGELQVVIDGRSTTYRSVDDLLKARATLARMIEGASVPNYRLASTDKGV